MARPQDARPRMRRVSPNEWDEVAPQLKRLAMYTAKAPKMTTRTTPGTMPAMNMSLTEVLPTRE